MIRAAAKTDKGRTIVMLGLEDGNLQLLQEGKPIHIHFEEMDIPFAAEICIFYAKDKMETEKEFQKFITKETNTNERRNDN